MFNPSSVIQPIVIGRKITIGFVSKDVLLLRNNPQYKLVPIGWRYVRIQWLVKVLY